MYIESTPPHPDFDFETACVHGNRVQNDAYGAIATPIYQTATFAHEEATSTDAVGKPFTYSRDTNPTRTALESTIAALHNAKGALAFTSGMSAIAMTSYLFKPNGHIVVSQDLYGGTTRIFNKILPPRNIEVRFADTSNIDAYKDLVVGASALYIETPSNPMMNITDIRAAAKIAHDAGALLIVDNTFLSPYLQRPLELGADIVIESGTKFLGGHNDVVAGIMATNSADLLEFVEGIRMTIGTGLAPQDSWLLQRGLKTLALRLDRQQESALAIAQHLQAHLAVEEVHYAGLPSHPGYEVNRSQARGAGAVISFKLSSGEAAEKFLARVKLIAFAESLGGVDTLVTHPLTQTHADVPEELRTALGIDERLLRISVGIESLRDIVTDIDQALEG